MTLAIGDTAPDFEAETTNGRIRFHEWLGESWGVLFSHPKDFTPVCTTELGYMAKLKPEFDRRGVKIIGLSVDSTGDHEQWARDIEETQGTAPNYPIIADADFNVAMLYGMLPAGTSGDAKARKAADNQTAKHRVATPVNWQQGDDVIISGSASDDEAKTIYPDGWKSPKPYIRVVPQPS